jgi:RNA polymerase sigma factor (sigma-70 family)
VEASALHAPAGLSRRPLAIPLLRLRSDEQLVALFRAGSDDAFGVLHDRYRQRLFAYVRQMLSGHSRQDAEDVLQDVFVRAFGALRGDSRAVNVRAWLYRVAHNRCIDHLRRPHPPASEIFDMSRKPLLDPVDEAQRRDDLKRLVTDVGRLPEQQRSALLMREIDGLSYAELSGALDVTVPAVKSLLVRARVGLVEAQESRDADCGEIRTDLLASYDRGVKASGRARRHLRECSGCREYRQALRGVRRSFAALAPAGAGPAALLAKLIGAGGGAAAAGGGGGAALMGGAATATACKVAAAVVCATALTAGGAVEVHKLTTHPVPKREHVATAPAGASAAAPVPAFDHAVPTHVGAGYMSGSAAPAAVPRHQRAAGRSASGAHDGPITAPPPDAIPATGQDTAPVVVDEQPQSSSGGTPGPDEAAADGGSASTPPAGEPATGSAQPGTETHVPATAAQPAAPAPAPAEPAEPGGAAAPPADH